MSHYPHQFNKRPINNSNNQSRIQLIPGNSFKRDIANASTEVSNKNSTGVGMTYSKPFLLREDGEQRIPLFLIKLWNIVEDPKHWDSIRWDVTGMSFHIVNPYSFCSDILPYYFKHKNLNSLVRQLNMYGFRKNTPIDRSGLAHAESDQDHLEFFHPYFRRDHPELLANIKRKVPNAKMPMGSIHQLQAVVADPGDGMVRGAAGETVAVHSRDLTAIFDELKTLHERQRSMEMRMEELTKENEMLWNEMAHVRGTHLKQQQIVNKLIQFLVALVGPATGKATQHRLGKRPMYVLEDYSSYAGPKRWRDGDGEPITDEGDQIGGGGGIGGSSTGTAPICSSSSSSFGVSAASAGKTATSASATPITTPSRRQHQQQSILPANASEILDRLINEIASNGIELMGSGSSSSGGGKGQGSQDGGFGDYGGIRIDDLTPPHSAGSAVNNQQLQPYVVGGGGGKFGGVLPEMRQSRSSGSLNSGPIISELADDFDPIYTTIVEPLTPMQPSPQQQPQQKVQVVEQQHPSYQSYVNNTLGLGHQQKYAKKAPPPPALKKQQNLVIVQPRTSSTICPTPSYTTISPTQQQSIGKLQQQQQFMLQQQNNQPQQLQQQQNPMMTQQQKTGTLEPNVRIAQSPAVVEDELRRSTNAIGAPPAVEGLAPAALDAPISEGMVLNESEIADIAGLNSYLEENGARFNSLTNSIGEHWVNDDFQDLFESVNGLETTGGGQNPTSADPNHDEHLDFPFLDGHCASPEFRER